MKFKEIMDIKKTVIYILGAVLFFFGGLGIIVGYNTIDLSKDLYTLKSIYENERIEYIKFLIDRQYTISEELDLSWNRFEAMFPGIDKMQPAKRIKTFYDLIVNPITDINKNDLIIIATDFNVSDYEGADLYTRNRMIYKDFYSLILSNALSDTKINIIKYEEKTYRILKHVITDTDMNDHTIYIGFIEEDINAYLNHRMEDAILDLKDKVIFVIVALALIMVLILLIVIVTLNIIFKLSYKIEYEMMKNGETDGNGENPLELGNGLFDKFINHHIDGDRNKAIDYNKYGDKYSKPKPKDNDDIKK